MILPSSNDCANVVFNKEMVAVAGYPDPEVVWYKDDQPIKETRHFQIDYDEEGNCSLVISEVRGHVNLRQLCTEMH